MDPTWPVAAVGSMLVAFGALLLLGTKRATHAIATMDRELLQALGGGIRIVLGVLLFYGADASPFSPAVRTFAWIFIGVGVVVLAVRTSTFSAWVDGWLRGSLGWRLRVGGVLSIIVGVMLVGSVL
jgi:hypothetical protein